MSNDRMIELDEHQAVNLLSVLRASGCYDGYINPTTKESLGRMPQPNGLESLNSGDWIGELIFLLEKRLELVPHLPFDEFKSKRYGILHPNRTPQEYVKETLLRIEQKKAEMDRIIKERVKKIVEIVESDDAD